MKYGVGLVFSLSLALGCDGEGEERRSDDITQRCTRLRDHVIDVRLADAPLDVRSGSAARPPPRVDVRAQHRAALSAALGTDFITRCAQTITPAKIDCALDAPDRETVDACVATR